jgi:autotransporter-associated beta strand protein
MKLKSRLVQCLAAMTLVLPFTSPATIYFTDNFSNGSTTNGVSVPGGTAAASYTSYDLACTKDARQCTIGSGSMVLKLGGATAAGFWEAQALFTTNPVSLVQAGDYIEMQVVFTNTGGTLFAGGASSSMAIGLFNSANKTPVSGGALVNGGLSTTAGSAYATGNCADWQGYVACLSSNGPSRIYTRPQQNGANTASANQDLLGDNLGSGAFNNPRAATLVTGATAPIALTANAQYTEIFRITLVDASTMTMSNALFSGADTSGTMVYSQMVASTTNILTISFDGLGILAFNKGTAFNPTMGITSIQINGQTTAVTAPPDINQQPVSVTAPLGTLVPFSVSATGVGMTYQWHRNGTNLLNSANITGATSSTLIINPVTSADYSASYYVTVFGAGGFSTNSSIVSLTSGAARNLVWSGTGNVWDLNTSANWLNGSTASVFNYGDNVTFNDTGSANAFVTLTGTYLSAGSVTLDGATAYNFVGTGSFAGPGRLIYKGSGFVNLNIANTFTGGTIISNASAYLYVQNYAALGNGPVTLAKAGGLLEIVPNGAATTGIGGDVVVNDDFTIKFDGYGAFAGIFLGNLAGTAGKTLTLDNNTGTTNRFRVYGTSTICNANIVLNGNPSSVIANYDGTVLAPYNATGSQTYNGVISGVGGLVQRANGTTILNGANTYTGGTLPTTGSIGFGIDTASGLASGPIGTGPLYLAPELPNTSGSGTVFASGGARTIANPIKYPSGTNNQTLIIGGTNSLTLSGDITLNGMDAQTSATIINRTFQVTNTAATTFTGTISDGGAGYGFIKTGSGVLYLNGTSSYTSPTTNSGGLLAGSGSIAGSVYVQTNANIGGGSAAGIGTLTIGGNLSIAAGGGGYFRLNKAGSPTSDRVSVTGTISSVSTNTLTVTNLGTALVVGDSFTLFNKAVTGGGTLAIAGGGVTWSNRLAIDGTILVVPGFADYSTNITASFSGGSLTISWPSTHQGWILQVQTNTLGMGLTTASNTWHDISASSSTTQQVIPVNSANPSVFYRLRHP